MKSGGTHRDERYMVALLWDQISRICGMRQSSPFMRPTGRRTEEKRTFRRVPCSILVDYATQDQVYRSLIRNIAVRGAFIESSELDPGQEITLVFSILDHEQPIKIIGQVAWVGLQGMGVEFLTVY